MTGPEIDLDALLDALEFVSTGQGENEAFLCVETGVIHWHSELEIVLEPLPDDVDDAQKYIAIPHKNDLDLGKRLVLRFCRDVLPDAVPEVEEIFRRRGAYANFKSLLERRALLDQWYDYEAKAERDALVEWCRDNDIKIHGLRDAQNPGIS
jgi:hypothetical protein